MVRHFFWFYFLLCLMMSTPLCAQHAFIDVYGTDSKTAEKIINQVGVDLEKLSRCLNAKEMYDFCQDDQRSKLREKVIKEIHQNGDFAFVNLSGVFYRDLKTFVTIDIVERSDDKRMAYLSYLDSNQIKSTLVFKNDKKLNQLLEAWMNYEKIGFDLMKKGQAPDIKKCPAFHCVFGFDHPDLKKFGPLFEKEVPKNKNKLIAILKNDPDEERRMAAICLLAHIKDGQELIKILTPYLSDSKSGVRNDVMRVLGETLSLIKPSEIDIDIDPIIKALDYPLDTDRNKALCIIASLVKKPKYARYVAQHAGVPLMASLRMTQPNLHNNAYVLLRVISGQSYGDRDYASWEAWFAEQAHSRRLNHQKE